jgi:beta-ureidopropionase
VLDAYLPERERAEVKRILFGAPAASLTLPESAHAIAKKLDFDLVGYKISAQPEELRPPRIVRIGAIQNAIKAPTTASVSQ